MKKERWEWLRSWCDETNLNDLPRVLLIGDSITEGYQGKVREMLRGICYVDYVATSYAIDSKMYNELIKNYVQDSDYAVIHFNHGLHGFHMSARTYKSRMKKLLPKLEKKGKLILANTTVVYTQENKRLHTKDMKRVKERNLVVDELATQYGYPIDDLYTVSMEMSKEARLKDGVHYLDDGYEILATSVVESIKNALKS